MGKANRRSVQLRQQEVHISTGKLNSGGFIWTQEWG